MSSGKGLYKWNWVSVDPEDSRVIDNNELLEKRLSQQREMTPLNLANMAPKIGEEADVNGHSGEEDSFAPDDDFAPGEFRSGLNVTELDGILEDPDDNTTLIKAARPQEPVYEGPSPQDLIDEAQAKIDEMYAAANAEIEQLRSQTIEDAKSQGYNQGYEEGLARAGNEVEQRKAELEAQYERLIKELEPEFVRHISGIYEHIIRVKLSDYQNLVIQLLESCLQKTEGSRAYVVHVSVEDYPFVSMQKKTLLDAIGSRSSSFDIIEDNTLKKNECMIETDGGIYDCSLDSQLQALKRELMTVAYQGDD